MKITNGTDIIEINRIKQNIEKYGDKFLKRIFTQKEIEYCEKRKNFKYQSYAVRFAAKEATYKALSEYINFKYYWNDFEVINEKNGKPVIKLNFELNNLKSLEVSLSHCKTYAIANVIAIFQTKDE